MIWPTSLPRKRSASTGYLSAYVKTSLPKRRGSLQWLGGLRGSQLRPTPGVRTGGAILSPGRGDDWRSSRTPEGGAVPKKSQFLWAGMISCRLQHTLPERGNAAFATDRLLGGRRSLLRGAQARLCADGQARPRLQRALAKARGVAIPSCSQRASSGAFGVGPALVRELTFCCGPAEVAC